MNVNVDKLKGRIRELGYTQSDVAKLMEIDPSTLNGKINDPTGKRMSVADAGKLARILDIEVMTEYFFYA